MADLIDIRRVQIGPENLVAQVRIAGDAPLMTSEDVDGTARVYRLLPHIVEHACLGDAGETFKDARGDTEIAHLLEHVIISLQVRERNSGDATFIGTTVWIYEQEGLASVEFGFRDDLVALRAFNEAVKFVNVAVLTCLA